MTVSVILHLLELVLIRLSHLFASIAGEIAWKKLTFMDAEKSKQETKGHRKAGSIISAACETTYV